MTKKQIIELYLADLNNLVPDSATKRNRILDLENELKALTAHSVKGQSKQLSCRTCMFNTESWNEDYPCAICNNFDKHKKV